MANFIRNSYTNNFWNFQIKAFADAVPVNDWIDFKFQRYCPKSWISQNRFFANLFIWKFYKLLKKRLRLEIARISAVSLVRLLTASIGTPPLDNISKFSEFPITMNIEFISYYSYFVPKFQNTYPFSKTNTYLLRPLVWMQYPH